MTHWAEVCSVLSHLVVNKWSKKGKFIFTMKSILVLTWPLGVCKPIHKETMSSAKLGGGDL